MRYLEGFLRSFAFAFSSAIAVLAGVTIVAMPLPLGMPRDGIRRRPRRR
jgi:hypothetical protein